MLETLLHKVTREPAAWITTVGEVAAYHASSVNQDRYVVPMRTPESMTGRRFGKEK